MNWKAFLILATMFGLLTYWVTMQLAAPIIPRKVYTETPAERARIEKRIAYHGLNGVVVLRESPRGWEFQRSGRWCKL
jgi:hypothetical protein